MRRALRSSWRDRSCDSKSSISRAPSIPASSSVHAFASFGSVPSRTLVRTRCSMEKVSSAMPPSLALDAEHLLQRVHHFHEVGLVAHHLVDVLVGAGDLGDDALV